MDDFRVGSTSPIDAYHDREHSGPRDRKGKRRTHEAAEDGDQVTFSGPAENSEEAAEDYYTPSGPPEES